MLGRLLNARNSVIEIAIASIFLAVSVNLLSSAAFELLGQHKILFGSAISFFLFGAAAMFLLRKLTSFKNSAIRINSCICIDRKTGEILRIPRYHFSEKICIFIRAAFAENSALRDQWSERPLTKMLEISENGNARISKAGAPRLVEEAAEYLFLSSLSTHLTDYFNTLDIEKNAINLIDREQLHGSILSNRFLNIFSTPMQDRSAFSEFNAHNNSENIVSSGGPGGVLFDKFELNLPSGSTINRSDKNCIDICTKNFKLSAEFSVPGFNSNSPPNFSELYLKKNDRDVSFFLVITKLSVEFSMPFLLTKRARLHDEWLDAFLRRYSRRNSFKKFIKRIDWHRADAMTHIAGRSRQTPPARPAPSALPNEQHGDVGPVASKPS